MSNPEERRRSPGTPAHLTQELIMDHPHSTCELSQPRREQIAHDVTIFCVSP